MSEVFISYKREDRALAAALDQFLRMHGLSVWWDTSLIAGEQFNQSIAGALAKAKCIVVLWTELSHASQYVQAEAIDGFARKILVAARLDDVQLAYPFPIIQTADLRGWRGEPHHPGLEKILEGVRSKLSQPVYAPTHYPPAPAGIPILGRTARANDRSIWEDPGDAFDFQEASSFRQILQSVEIAQGPRAYARCIPASWQDGPLAVSEFTKLAEKFSISAPSNAYDSGTFGYTYFGALQFWFSGHEYQRTNAHRTGNACLYFDDTGEFWIIHGTAIVSDGQTNFLLAEPTITNWSKTLRKIMKVFDDHGASPERRVEVGLAGLSSACWPNRHRTLAHSRARKDGFVLDRQMVGWSEEQQQAVLRQAYNETLSVFSLPKLDQRQFLADLRVFDSERFSARPAATE